MAKTKLITSVGSKFLLIRKIFTFSLISFFLFVIFVNAITESVQQRSVVPLITDIGGRFLLASQNLEDSSMQIIEQGYVWIREGGYWRGLWQSILSLSDFISNAVIIWLWIKLLAFLISISWISDRSRAFVNYSLGILIFIVLQIMFIIINAAVTGTITGFVGGDNSVVYLIMLPFKSIYTFFKAFLLIFTPLGRIGKRIFGDKLGNAGNLTNNITN